MKCPKCWAPVGTALNCFRWIRRSKNQFEFSKTAKAIEEIKKGIDAPKFDDVCNMPILPNSTIGIACKNDPELSFFTGFELAILQCGEILAKAQDDDK